MRDLEEKILPLDQLEAIRLADVQGLQHAEAARIMGISRQTFGRVLIKAHKTIAACLTQGHAIRIEGGAVHFPEPTSAPEENTPPA